MRVKPKATKATFRSKDSSPLLLSKLRAGPTDKKSPHGSRTITSPSPDIESPSDEDEMDVDELSPETFRDKPKVRDLLSSPARMRDELVTKTTVAQDGMVEVCLPPLTGAGKSTLNAQGIPHLDRAKHVAFLKKRIKDAQFMQMDAARPWFVYWCLTGLTLLSENVEVYRERVVKTFAPCQNVDGGFGGGHGQFSHLAPSYAVVLSLAMVGGSESLGLIDRRSLWKWLGRLKQSDGGFQMCIGGEEDVRGTYCAMTIVSLLNLPLQLPPESPARVYGFISLIDGLPEYLARCQTYEGGISGKPESEAHGSYAFCALACLCILGPPHEMIPRYLDLPLLVSWLSARQYAPEGGLSGRTNKLVDGCYSHWVGGCSPLIQAALNGPQSNHTLNHDKAWVGSFYDEEGLIRYILSCCQDRGGGLSDNPGVLPDAYHSCYVLAGFSSTHFYNEYSITENTGGVEAALASPMHWIYKAQDLPVEDDEEVELLDAADKVEPLHPVYVIPWDAAQRCHGIFSKKTGF